MLKQLLIENLVLVENVEISFASHLNIITGETGSGKSALIEAISLCLGKRSDASLVRKGCEYALVEAHFEIDASSPVWECLRQAGIPALPEEMLIIRRQIHTEGKNKAFINCKLVTLPLLQEISAHLVEIVNQSAHHELRSHETQRMLLDLFGAHDPLLEELKTSFFTYQKSSSTLAELKGLEQRRLKEESLLHYQLKEIEESCLFKADEESLFNEYTILQNAEEILQRAHVAMTLLAESSTSVISHLNKAKGQIQPYFEEVASLLEEAQIASTEAASLLSAKTADIAPNPKRLEVLEKQLSSLHTLLKKYGPTKEDVKAYQTHLLEKLETFSSLEETLLEAEEKSASLEKELKEKAFLLRQKRKKAAHDLSFLLQKELEALNMPSAEVRIEVKDAPLSSQGHDEICFLLQANKGEAFASVKEKISGGELCRLLFAIKALLAKKNLCPTLIFDEIDANVGGMTASVMGEKLKELSKKRQVLCITHFAQVAKYADLHLAVSKEERDDRTITCIEILSEKKIERELQRMMGHLPISSC